MSSAIIIGGGYSVVEGIEKGLWDKIRGRHDIWSLNFAFHFLLEQNVIPSRQLWVDTHFFTKRKEYLEDLHKKHGVALYTKEHPKYDLLPITQFNTFKSPQEEGLRPNSLFVGGLGFVGVFALSLACHEKIDTVYLLGYDFGTSSMADSKTHWYQERAGEYSISSSGVNRPQVYRDRATNQLLPCLGDFSYFLKFQDTRIVNVSLKSNINTFERIGYDEFFQRLCGN